MKRLPIHLAYHLLGSARTTPEGVAVRSTQGPLIEGLAEAVDELTVVASEPRSSQGAGEDSTDYVVAGQTGNVHLLSLGPAGSWRTRRRRAKRVAGIVTEPSRSWDVLAYRFPNRRAYEVGRAQRCPRTVVIDGGAVGQAARMTPGSLPERLKRMALASASGLQEALVLRSAGVVFVNSRQLARRRRRWAPLIEVLQWSLRRGRFAFQATDRLMDSARFMVAGRITESKGVFEALDAFKRVKTEVLPGAHLHVVGDGDGVMELRQRVQRHGLHDSVTFHGWVPMGEELFRLFRSMDVMLHLSYAESFPRVVWEALAHSVLVVCTPVGGLPEVLTDRQEVLFVPVHDAGAAAQAVRELERRPELRRRMLEAGFGKAKETSIEAVVQRIIGTVTRVWPELDPASAPTDPSVP